MKIVKNNKMILVVKTALILIGTLGMLQSCTNNEDIDSLNVQSSQSKEFKFLDKVYKVPNGSSIWEAQLNKIKEDDTLLKSSDIILVNYKYVKTIKNEEELRSIKSDMANKQIIFPSYKDNSYNLSTISMEESKKNEYIDFLNKLIPVSEIKHNLGIVEIEWKYKGRVFNTLCFVSEKKGAIYDNILYFVVSPSETTKSYSNKAKTAPRYKASAAEGSYTIAYGKTISDDYYNSLGYKAWSYRLIIVIYGVNNNGVNSITTYQKEAVAEHGVGYSCEADIQVKSISPGVNGHVDYQFGYGYSTSIFNGISMSWNGISYTFTGGGYSYQSGEYVNPKMLY